MAAMAALVPAWLRAPGWILALLLSAILVVVWLVVIVRFLRANAWSGADA